jgi:hypothetical protein
MFFLNVVRSGGSAFLELVNLLVDIFPGDTVEDMRTSFGVLAD